MVEYLDIQYICTDLILLFYDCSRHPHNIQMGSKRYFDLIGSMQNFVFINAKPFNTLWQISQVLNIPNDHYFIFHSAATWETNLKILTW